MFYHIAMTWEKVYLHLQDGKNRGSTFSVVQPVRQRIPQLNFDFLGFEGLRVLEVTVVFMVDAASVVATAVEMGKKVLMWKC